MEQFSSISSSFFGLECSENFLSIIEHRNSALVMSDFPGAPKHRGEVHEACSPLVLDICEESHGHRSLAGYSPWGPKSRTRLSN